MEGSTKLTNKVRFIESKKRLKTENDTNFLQAGKKLITAANNHGLLLVGFDKAIKKIQIDTLLDFVSSQANIMSSNLDIFVNLTFSPTILTVARYGYSSTLLVLGLNDGYPVIEAFDLDTFSSIGRIDLVQMAGVEIVDYAWHPNYFESVCALCSNKGYLMVLGVSKTDKAISILYQNQDSKALTCCWSPKGKNLAVGTINGEIYRMEPVISDNDFKFKEVHNSTLTFSSPVSTQHQLVKLRWLNKKYLVAVHAKLGDQSGPETVYSLCTIKPTDTKVYWPNLCIETQSYNNYSVHLANLTNSVLCATSATGEIGLIGVLGAQEATKNELSDWASLVIEEEGARVELPLDSRNRETHPVGLTIAYVKNGMPLAICGKPILVIYTSEGVINSYAAIHSEDIFTSPENQPAQTLNLPIRAQTLNPPIKAQTLNPLIKAQTLNPPINAQTLNLPIEAQSSLMDQPHQPFASQEPALAEIRKKIEYNEAHLSLFTELNFLRAKLDEVCEIHQAHSEALTAVKQDIDAIDLNILETFYLIEYIRNNSSKKRSLDPSTTKKVENLNIKLKTIEEKLEDINDDVDVSWEDFVRHKTKNERSAAKSIDMIYKTLATNQKIINSLKKKVTIKLDDPPEATPKRPLSSVIKISNKYREFFESRSVVPVRKNHSKLNKF